MLDPIDFAILKLSDCVEPEVLESMEASGELHILKKGVTVEHRGDQATHISFVKSGLIRLRLNEVDGSRFNMSILGRGSTFGETALFMNLPVQYDAYCQTDAELVRLSRDGLDTLVAKNIGFLEGLNKIANARVHTMLNYIGDSIRAPLEVRVTKFLALMSQESEDKQVLHCRQADLAHALGVSRVSMGKSLKSLESQSIIQLGYGKIIIPNLLKLESKASEPK